MYTHTHTPSHLHVCTRNCQRVSGTDRLKVAQTGTHVRSLPSPLWCSACWKESLESAPRLWVQPMTHPLETQGWRFSPRRMGDGALPESIIRASCGPVGRCDSRGCGPKAGGHRVTGTHGGCLEGFMCPGDKGLWGGLGLAGEKTGLCQLGASHCGLSVVDFQAQRLYKSNWWIIKLQMTH